MKRAIFLAAVVLVFGGCDPIRRLSVSRPIPASLDRNCVVSALRMEQTVREVGTSDAGKVYAVLSIPQQLQAPPRRTEVGVEESRNDKGELEINFWTLWVGASGSREYRDQVEKTLEQLRDRTIERCGGK